MLDAFHADQGVGDFLDHRSLAPNHEHLQAMVVVQMEVHARHNVAMEVVLDMGQLFRQITHLMVVDKRDGADRLFVLIPFLPDERIANKIAKRFERLV